MSDLENMKEVLRLRNTLYMGWRRDAQAMEWLEEGFTPDQAAEWLYAGCWDPSTASTLRDSGITAEQAQKAAEILRQQEEAEWDAIDEQSRQDDPENWEPCARDSRYTDADAMYSLCNDDTLIDEIIEALRKA
jgi:hypothetical protein